jgi:hypothetical protein
MTSSVPVTGFSALVRTAGLHRASVSSWRQSWTETNKSSIKPSGEPTVGSDLTTETLTSEDLPDEIQRRAALLICARATDPEDARHLLEVCGLIPMADRKPTHWRIAGLSHTYKRPKQTSEKASPNDSGA